MQLIYEKLPSDIANRHVLLLDPVLATGLTNYLAYLSILLLINHDQFKIIEFSLSNKHLC
jgi:uracil phosphoribosyltransferase